MNDLISVIIPCYNGEKYLRETINNVLTQTYKNIELIVIDDGSTDNSRNVIKEFGDKAILISQENKGLAPTRNVGIKRAIGKYIAFLDADDYWEPHCLESLYNGLKNTDSVLSYCGWQNVGEKKQGEPYVPPDYELDDKVECFLKSASPWPVHAALVRTNIVKGLSGFDERLITCEDYELWLRIAIKFPITRVEQVLAYYRHHDSGQMTSNQWRQAEYVLRVKENFIRKNPDLVKHLSKKKIKELTDGAFLKRGYDAYWKRDLISAHIIFRKSLKRLGFKLKDLKYLILALLPQRFFINLIQLMDKSSR